MGHFFWIVGGGTVVAAIIGPFIFPLIFKIKRSMEGDK
jgi:hypothetical protein